MIDFLQPLDDTSTAFLMIRHWGPSIITIVVGGICASILFPRWQAQYNRAKALGERKVALLEDIAVQFTLYIAAWRRLISIAKLERDRDLTEREMTRKDQFVQQRGETRDELLQALAKAKIYFSRQSRHQIDDFVLWDQMLGSKTLEELPPIEEWRIWEERISKCLRYEIKH